MQKHEREGLAAIRKEAERWGLRVVVDGATCHNHTKVRLESDEGVFLGIVSLSCSPRSSEVSTLVVRQQVRRIAHGGQNAHHRTTRR